MTEKEFNKLFAKRIKCRLKFLNIDQRELAKRSGLTEVTVSRYIHGRRKPSTTIVVRIAQALECSPGDLINIDEPLV